MILQLFVMLNFTILAMHGENCLYIELIKPVCTAAIAFFVYKLFNTMLDERENKNRCH